MDSNTLKLVIRLQDEASDKINKFSKNVQNSMSESGKASSGFGMSLSRVGEIVAGLGIAKLATSLIDYSKTAIQAGIATASFYENAQIGYKTLLGNSEKASKVLKQIQADALATPFDTQALVKANQLLISTGLGADESRKAVLDLGNAILASGGGNDELMRMSVNLQQIKNVGKATALDIKQFAFAGIPIYRLLAEATGKNVDQVRDMDVSYDLLTKSFDKAAQKGGMFYKGIENAAGSFQQRLSNLKESFNVFMADILTESGAFDFLKQKMLETTDFINNLKTGLIGFIRQLRGVKDVSAIQAPNSSKVSDGMAASIMPKIPPIPKMPQLLDAGTVQMFRDFLDMLKPVADLLRTSLKPAFDELNATIQKNKPQLEALSQAFSRILGPAIIGVVMLVVGAITVVVSIISGLVTAISAAIGNVIAIAQGIADFLQGFMNFLTGIFLLNGDLIKQGWAEMWTAIVDVVANAILGVLNLIAGFITGVIDFFFQLYQTLVGGSIVPDMVNAIIRWFTTLYSSAMGIFNGVKNFIINVWNGISSSVSSVVTSMVNNITQKLTAFKNGVINIKNAIVSAFSSLASGIMSALKTIKFPHMSIGTGEAEIAGRKIQYPKLSVSWYEKGGYVPNTGLAMLHAGEFVMSKDMLSGKKNMPDYVTENFNQPISITNIVNGQADLDSLGYQLAWAMRNSR